MNVAIRKATLSDVPLIQELSETIWKKHYTSIISIEQIEYMLQKMYSSEKLDEELSRSDYTYYMVEADGKTVGYIAISNPEPLKYLLHKFYILQEQRYLGLGEKVFQLTFKDKAYSQIQLFVNRQNYKSVNFYFKMGFKIMDVVDNHFGDGFYMNDFIMVKTNTPETRRQEK